LRIPPRPPMDDPLELMKAKAADAANAGKRNQKKAVLAWSSRHRLPMSWEPFVRLFVEVYELLLQLCTPSLAAKTTPATKVKMAARRSPIAKKIPAEERSMKAAPKPTRTTTMSNTVTKMAKLMLD